MKSPRLYLILAPSVQPDLHYLDSGSVPLHRPSHLREDVTALMRTHTERVDMLIIASPEEIRMFQALFPSRRTRRLRFAFVAYAVVDPDPHCLRDLEGILDLRTGRISPLELTFILDKARQFFRKRDEDRLNDWKAKDSHTDQQALITIGRALAFERNPDSLLRSILHLSKKMTGADAGSIFLVEPGEEGPRLRFKHSHTFSKELDYEEFTMPLTDSSIAGYVAIHGRVLNIPDVYHLEDTAPYGFNKSYDQKHGYRTRSMLAVPLISPGGPVLGVLQLINCKEAFHTLRDFSGNEAYEVVLETPEDFNKKVVPFEPRYEPLLEAVAAQASIALENNRLFLQIERQFEAFVEASVRAIEARDPSTAGHSFRVARTAELVARAINAEPETGWQGRRFGDQDIKQLTLACLLHDFGKVYIDYQLFAKAKKFLPQDLRTLDLRWDLLHRSLELQTSPAEALDGKLSRLTHLRKKVLELAEPTPRSSDLGREVEDLLREASEFTCCFPDGRPLPFLTTEEAENLRIPRGSLNGEERKIIESHVDHSYNFVKNIPWPQEFARIPDFVRMHHEMLDGSGYPQGLKGDQIPLEARIIALADVFDALSAADRPYKKALPIDLVLVILKEEAQKGRLDPELLDLFIRREIPQTILKGA